MDAETRTKFTDTVEFEAFAEDPVREWPLIVEVTEYRVVWIEADDQDEAFERAKQSGDLYESWSNAVEADWAVRLPNRWDWGSGGLIRQAHWNHHMTRETEGPMERCPECEAVAYDVTFWALQHRKGCTREEARRG